MRHQHTTSSLRLWLSGLALSVVLATQWLAVMHGASGHGRGQAPSVVAQAQAETASALPSAHSLALAHDDGSLFCKLLDHCLQAGHVAAHAIVVQGISAAIPLAAVVTAAPSARWVSYLARAPPALVPMHQA